MTVPRAETGLQKEKRLFWELAARLLDALLNRMFDLHPRKALRRSLYLILLFLFSGFALSLIYYQPADWAKHVGNVLASLLSRTSTVQQFLRSINNLRHFITDIVLDARMLQYLPVFLASFFIALQTAAMYLADVFELKDAGVARRFIRRVALTGSQETIHIKNGEVEKKSENSPVILIGGPGKLVVEVDSVALFERPNGVLHIVGPTGKEPGGKATLEGFERFRHAINIRDHFVELRDQNDDAKAVKSRSLDGIPVKATDVRFMFSIFRGDHPEATDEQPYPFSRDAVEQIVFKAASRVKPENPNPSEFKFKWVENMIRLIRGQLGSFMSRHRLNEYMASIGMPEVEKARLREEAIFTEMKQIAPLEDEVKKKEFDPPPSFQARAKVRNLFAQFAEDFTGKAHQNGVELHWIGVGTWESQLKIVPEKHMDAWLLTQENLKNDSLDELKRVEQKEIVEKMTELIQKVPLDAFEAINTVVRDAAYIHKVKALLLEYRKQFQETADFLKDRGKAVPQNILDAIKYIDNQIAHWAGSSQS